MCRPSRRTVTVSAIAPTSSSRWLMKMIATPRSRSCRTMREQASRPRAAESAAVGSSMISRRASDESALAISSSCLSATPSPRTGVSGPKSTPSSARMRLASGMARQSTPPRCADGVPRRRSRRRSGRGTRVGSWYIGDDPACGPFGRRRSDRLPVDQDLAVVLLDDAGHDLHQRRLAGAVLAHQCVHVPATRS